MPCFLFLFDFCVSNVLVAVTRYLSENSSKEEIFIRARGYREFQSVTVGRYGSRSLTQKLVHRVRKQRTLWNQESSPVTYLCELAPQPPTFPHPFKSVVASPILND